MVYLKESLFIKKVLNVYEMLYSSLEIGFTVIYVWVSI